MEEEITNFDEVLLVAELGNTPGSVARRGEGLRMDESPSLLRRRGDGSMEEGGQESTLSPMVLELVKSLASYQAKNEERNSKSLDQNSEALASISKYLQDVSKSSKRRSEENVEERLLGEAPVTIDFKQMNFGEGQDNSHDKLCWEVRRCWRMVNRAPADYWKQDEDKKVGWPARVEPNLAGQVYLDHLVPQLISDKALSWVHNGASKLQLRHFLHSNCHSRSSKAQKMEIKTRENDTDGGIQFESYISWSEAGSVKEMMEGVLNFVASLHQIRPWDYGGLVLIRALHDVNYFSLTARTVKEQRELVQEFVEAIFVRNMRGAQMGRPPLTLKEAKQAAEELVSKKNGSSYNLTAQCDPYANIREAKEKDEKIKKLQEEVKKVKQALHEERQKGGKKSAYDTYEPRKDGRAIKAGGDRKGLGKPAEEFYAERQKTCRWFNQGDCRHGADCKRGDHRCSAQVGKGMCGASHSRADHE